jgi:phenylalanine-4-hydroxylase
MVHVYYTKDEHQVWSQLIEQQISITKSCAHPIFIEGLQLINFSSTKIPSIDNISHILKEISGWDLVLVDKLVPDEDFFYLLACKKFPISISIRPKSQINFYTSVNPDLFHDYFGHCPFLLNKQFAEFVNKLGIYATKMIKNNPRYTEYFKRFYGFTLEFGLVNTEGGLKIYGAGILPSKDEINNALYNPEVKRLQFKLPELLASPMFYITQKQELYYCLDKIEDLFDFDFNLIGNTIESIIKGVNSMDLVS